MTTITQDAAAAFRDYETDGVPASGGHKPGKSDIRALFARIDTQLQALQALSAGVNPVGTVIAMSGVLLDTGVPGYLAADGATVSRDTYATLWHWVQNSSVNLADTSGDYDANPARYGPGDGVHTFDLPNLGDLTLQGWKDGDTDIGQVIYDADASGTGTRGAGMVRFFIKY